MAKVKIDQDKCSKCGICLKACPEPGVITRDKDKTISINTLRCKLCLLCASVCPKDAIAKDESD